jgi:hypothetical protein
MKRPVRPRRPAGAISVIRRDVPEALRPVAGRRVLILGEEPETSRSREVPGHLDKAPVLRVDLAESATRYIGETEKNLTSLFGHALARDVLILFDEADALFGKRTEVRDSHDRYSNLESKARCEESARAILRYTLRMYPMVALALDKRTPVPAWLERYIVSIVDGVEER